MTLQIAQQLVEHDVKHLDKIEMMLEEISLDEFDKNIFRVSIVEARENHKLANNL
jgi:tRNA-binding EMAP/Myf-like protein